MRKRQRPHGSPYALGACLSPRSGLNRPLWRVPLPMRSKSTQAAKPHTPKPPYSEFPHSVFPHSEFPHTQKIPIGRHSLVIRLGVPPALSGRRKARRPRWRAAAYGACHCRHDAGPPVRPCDRRAGGGAAGPMGPADGVLAMASSVVPGKSGAGNLRHGSGTGNGAAYRRHGERCSRNGACYGRHGVRSAYWPTVYGACYRRHGVWQARRLAGPGGIAAGCDCSRRGVVPPARSGRRCVVPGNGLARCVVPGNGLARHVVPPIGGTVRGGGGVPGRLRASWFQDA